MWRLMFVLALSWAQTQGLPWKITFVILHTHTHVRVCARTHAHTYTHTTKLVRVLRRRSKYVFTCILASSGGIFVKIHISNSTHTPYTSRKFCCDKAKITCTLHEHHSPFSSISWFWGDRLPWEFATDIQHTSPTCIIRFNVLGQ
jgi:hypothetical protein